MHSVHRGPGKLGCLRGLRSASDVLFSNTLLPTVTRPVGQRAAFRSRTKPGVGRRAIGVDEQERWVFNRVAAHYRNRPGYPDALIQRLSELAQRAGGRVLDLGAGTGHLTLPLVKQGHRLTAVEPARAMLAELRSCAAREHLGVEAVNASAEHTGLPDNSFDLIVVADALQWIDPELAGQEVARLLEPHGVLAVVEARLGDTPFMDKVRELLSSQNPKAGMSPPTTLNHFLSLVSKGIAPRTEAFIDDARLDEALLGDIIQSLTFVGPALGPANLEKVLREARRLLTVYPGATWRRDLVMTWVSRDP